MKLAAATASLLAFAALGSGAGAEEQTRVLDRTYSCAVRGVGSPETVRYVDVYGEPRIGRYAPWAHVASIDGDALQVGEPPQNDSFGAGFRTGRTQNWGAGAWLNLGTCAATRTRAALGSRGLRGGPIADFHESYRCDVPARVLLRVRAVFRSPASLRRDPRVRYHLTAGGRIASAEVAVRAANGRPLVYASVDDRTGRTSIFTSPSRCFRT